MRFFKKFIQFLLFLTIFTFAFLSLFNLSLKMPAEFKWDARNPNLVLLWTRIFYDSSAADVQKINKELKDTCPYECEYIDDQSRITQANAIIFRGEKHLVKSFPEFRHQSQVWIFFRYESPEYLKVNPLPLEVIGSSNYPYFFNWTATYRRDSDMPYPYGHFFKIFTNKSGIPSIESIKNKKLISWMVSNCKTPLKREKLVENMQQYIPIDIYGSCGKLKCLEGYAEGWDSCYKELGSQYKFYLSFENSYCVDYVTEKFFLPFQNDMVPIVFGGANYSAIAPPGSYINVDDFKTVQELANYLIYLDRNPEEYLKFFEWRRDYDVKVADVFGDTWLFCEICRRLNERDNLVRKSYPDLKSWWYQSPIDGSSACKIPKLPEFTNIKSSQIL